MITSVTTLLPQVLKFQEDWRICLLNNWQTIVGSLKTRIRLEKIQKDILIIGVYESHWMQELFLLSRVLIHAINKHLGQQCINRLKFRLIGTTALKPARYEFSAKSVVIPKEIKLTYQQQEALDTIKDEHLQNALKKFLFRCMM